MGTIINPTPAATMLEEQRLGYTGCSLTNFDNTSEPQIGGNFEVAGSLGSFASAESITGWSGLSNGDVYIKIVPDTGAGTVAAEFTATAPTWDDVKQGWYGTGGNANHRYLFKLEKTGASGYENKRVMNQTGDSLEVGYRADQDLRTTDPAVFASINTGQGVTEVYQMDQAVRTTDSVTHSSLDVGAGAIKEKVLNIGVWDMDTDYLKAVAHGVADRTKIRSIYAIVQDDTATGLFPLDAIKSQTGVLGGGVFNVTSTNIQLIRADGGYFDSASFNSTSVDRGKIFVTYED